MASKKELNYEPIPSEDDRTWTCLSIRPPGTWFENADYVVFVGGCGVATARTLREARDKLFQAAVSYCERRRLKHQNTATHYANAAFNFRHAGLKLIKESSK